MAADPQHTISSAFEVEGVGVHTGETVSLRAAPAPEDAGIVFRRADLADSPPIRACLDNVSGTELGVALGAGDAQVRTVEHLLAALAALQVDNAMVDVRGPEVPILDGSFAPWTTLLRDAGVTAQAAPARHVRIAEAFTFTPEGAGSYAVLPCEELRVSATIDFDHPLIGRQYGDFAIGPQTFPDEVAPARTFGFLRDEAALRERGFARGASLDNTVVLDGDRVLNGDLRFPDEFVRHKAGDLAGDLALLGARLRARVVADRPSHSGNVALARELRGRARRAEGAAGIDVRQIMRHLPHRYPMLLVDRIVEYEPGKMIVGIKNVTINEPFFRGHFPEHPIMPGVLVVEAMAQVGGLMLMDFFDNPEDKVVYFMSLNNVKWRRPVTPGDQVAFTVELTALRRRICRMKGVGRVDGKVVAEAEMAARVVDR